MHGNLGSHPDIPEILGNIEKAAKLHERNENIAAGLLFAGAFFTSAGLLVAGAEHARLKYLKG